MILLYFSIILSMGVIHCEECTLFNQNTAEVASDVFEKISGPIKKVVNNELDNDTLTLIESLYNEYKTASNNEDIHLNITELLKKYEYPVEQHTVETEDGYLLGLFRIPSDGPPVLVLHGLFCSSDDFVTMGPGTALAYLLSDAGFDVWLGNARGNLHSRQHVTLSPSCAEFWDFSFNEIGLYDLPAMIDYVLEKTNQKQLIYMGHSQGTTSYFIMCSEKPEYNDKIKLMIALSAVVYMNENRSPVFQGFAPFYPVLEETTKILGINEFLPRNPLLQYLTDTFCGTPALATLVCNNLLFFIFGFDYPQVNATVMPVIFGHVPGGISIKQFFHYIQLTHTGGFRKYDHGVDNLKKYGSLTPPDYPIEKVTSPVAIFYSENDWMAPKDNLEKLKDKLPNIVKIITVPFKKFAHVDYLFAKDVKELLYDTVIDLAGKYV